ncbi:MAG TPA: hypothetical protein VHE23_02885 [Candidatus Acidoferrales bacterium]|nr:hypothetical protein [Candidatus Acidoferrales bacterium]
MASAASATPGREGGFRRLWRVSRQLFHEMTGAVFAVLALAWANAALRAWSRDVAPWLVAAAVAVVLVMAYFSWTSFRRAQRIR